MAVAAECLTAFKRDVDDVDGEVGALLCAEFLAGFRGLMRGLSGKK